MIYIEIISIIFDNFLLYVFYQTLFERRKKNIPCWAIFVAFAAVDVVFSFAAYNFFGDSSLAATITRYVLTCTLNFLITLFYTSSLFYRFLVVISYSAIITICENLSYYIIIHFSSPATGLSELSDTSFTAISLVSNLLILLCTMILNVFKRNKSTVRSRIYIALLLIVPAMSCMLTFLPGFFNMNIVEPAAYLTLVIFLLIINITNYILLQNVLKAEALAHETRLLQQQVNFQKSKYMQLSDAYKNIRGFMHDTKKHLFYIENCVNEGKYDNIIPYARETMTDLESRYCTVNTGNLVIDAFVSNMILQTASQGITLSTTLKVDKNNIPCDDYHMTIILGNLMDNALNACIGQTGSSIQLKIQALENSFVIYISNTYHIPPFEKTPDSFDNIDFIHNYELKNVKNSAEECGGFCVIDYANGIYSVSVIIPLSDSTPRESDK